MSLAANEISADEVRDLAVCLETEPLTAILQWAWERFGPRAAIGTSFQGAGLVMIDHAVKAGLPLPVFTLDTNLLFPETYELKRRIEEHFRIVIEPVEPGVTLDQQAKDFGALLWTSNPDLCCQLRKVEPLKAKFEQLSAWITGLRRQQSDTREKTRVIELYHFDLLRDRYILKMNPMATWSRDQVWDYIKAHNIPYNPLHDSGFRSIGCWPCTRPTAAGENERAGRWTGFDKAECGIHTFLGDSI
jgi:phosphoadenosine phosphosulfate reductase